MRPHRIPTALALLALPLGLLAGCGSGGTTATTGAAAAKTTAATTAARTAPQPATTTAPAAARSPAARAAAALVTQVNTPPKHRFAAAPITHAAVSQLARRGSIVVPVAVGGPGKVSAFGQAEIPGKGIVHVAEAAPRTIARAGVVRLAFALTPVARAQLAAGRSILMYVAVLFSKGDVIERIPVRLRP